MSHGLQPTTPILLRCRFARQIHVHARLDHKGKTVFEEDLPADPDEFLHAIKPFRKDVVVGCEYMSVPFP